MTTTRRAKWTTRWARFRLRTLLVVCVLFGVVFGVIGSIRQATLKRNATIAELHRAGVSFGYPFDSSNPDFPPDENPFVVDRFGHTCPPITYHSLSDWCFGRHAFIPVRGAESFFLFQTIKSQHF